MAAFSPSWIIKHRESGHVLFETFDERQVRNIERDPAASKIYEVVPIKEHLASLNKREPVQPSSSGGET